MTKRMTQTRGCRMKNRLMRFSVIILALMMVLSFAGCSKSEEAPAEEAPAEETAEEETAETAEDSGSKYGYSGDDPVIAEVYSYIANALSINFEEADCSIPVVQIVDIDESDESDIKVWGDFWVNNYDIDGDTLQCVSGGSFPGLIHIEKNEDGYKVTSMDVVEEGGEFESSAKEIFGDNFDKFMQINSDSDTREKIRAEIAAEYVRQNGLSVTKYQDADWDPVDLPL